MDCGALCLPGLAEATHSLVHAAAASGARILAGGQFGMRRHRDAVSGQYYAPTVVADVTPEMRLFREETFGPVLCISRADSDEHAVCRACSVRVPVVCTFVS